MVQDEVLQPELSHKTGGGGGANDFMATETKEETAWTIRSRVIISTRLVGPGEYTHALISSR